MIDLRPFQRRFLRSAFAPGVDISCLSLPRGNGKSTLAGYLAARALTPGDALFVNGQEAVLCAASMEQARIVYRAARAVLEPMGGYRFQDAAQRIGIVHPSSGSRLRVISSSGKTAMGIVGVPLAIADEPGAWQVQNGELMADALMTAIGKPGSPLKVVFIGTLAPATMGWWPALVEGGSRPGRHVTLLQGNPDKWDQWAEIGRCNPLARGSPEFRKTLLRERDEAREDSRLKARFLSYRQNLPTADEAETLLTVDDWRQVLDRPVAARSGRPIVAYDLGAGRAWSAATAIWQSGRVEAIAVCPGIPSVVEQERRDRVPPGTYSRLVQEGVLRVAEGLRVQPVAQLHAAALAEWGQPDCILADRFRLNELRDCVRGVPLVERVTRWSEASEDIRALRKVAKDGPLSCDPESALLVTASLASAMVKNDDQGSVRLVKRGTNNTGRDDVAAALTLAAGAYARSMAKTVRPAWRYRGLAG